MPCMVLLILFQNLNRCENTKKKKKYRGSHPFVTFLSLSWPQRWHERSSFQLRISTCAISKFLDFSSSTDVKTILQKLQTLAKSAMSFSPHDAGLPNHLLLNLITLCCGRPHPPHTLPHLSDGWKLFSLWPSLF